MDLVGSGRCLSSVDPLRSGLRSCMCLRVESFRSRILFIGGGCCSDALVQWGLSTMSFELSTITNVCPAPMMEGR